MKLRATPEEVRHAVAVMVASAAGKTSAYRWATDQIFARMGVALLSQIQQDFITKSRGGTGRDGIKWAPLSPETIARRTVSAGEKRELNKWLKERREVVFKEELARLRRSWFGFFHPRPDGAGTDEEIDAKLKRKAGKTAGEWLAANEALLRRAKLTARQVDILRDTALMLKAFTPGRLDKPSGAPGQIFEVGTSWVTVGNKEKPWHQHGVPGRLLARPSWPEDNRIPEPWMVPIRVAALNGCYAAMLLIVQSGRVHK